MRIYIVFKNSDVNHIKNIVKANDLVIGDIGYETKLLCKVIKPTLSKCEEEKLIESVSSFFDNASNGYLIHIKAFSNTFYEATLRPIATYLIFLQNICASFVDKGINIEVVFPSRIINNEKRTVFFLAEHETQKTFLYKRQLIFQPYLEKFCRIHQIPVEYVSKNFFSLAFLTLPIRRFVTLSFRFCNAGFKLFCDYLIRNQNLKKNKAIDYIAVTRLARKSEFLEPILTNSALNIELVIAENFVNHSSNWSFCTKHFYNKGLVMKKMQRPDLSYFFLTYFKSFVNQFYKVDNFNIDVSGININCKNAFLELLVNYPDILLYINSLKKTIEHSKMSSQPTILSTELKSPYAYADAFVANKLGYPCIHIMDCDQSSQPLPNPIFGDLLVTNTNSSKEAFINAWQVDSEKISFWGNLTQMNLEVDTMSVNRNTWCFFTSAIIEEDTFIIEKIIEIKAIYNIEFIVKLHPRDSLRNYKKYKNVRIVADEQMSRNDLFKRFNYGLTFSSAVIHDLMIYKKPFLIIDKLKGAKFNRDVHSNDYQNLVVNQSQIIDSVLHMERFTNDFNDYNKLYLDEVFMSEDSTDFIKKLNYWKKNKYNKADICVEL
jgi:hypothetical protein